jgi:hypothetical protein
MANESRLHSLKSDEFREYRKYKQPVYETVKYRAKKLMIGRFQAISGSANYRGKFGTREIKILM